MLGFLVCIASSVATLVLNVRPDIGAGWALFGTMCCWFTWGIEALSRRRCTEADWVHAAFMADLRADERELLARLLSLSRRPPEWQN